PWFASARTRLPSSIVNATNRPSEETAVRCTDGYALTSDSEPSEATLTLVVVPEARSSTKTSHWPFVSAGTRSDAKLMNVRNLPSPERAGARLVSATRVVKLLLRSRRKTAG